jgi:hypothetical protein
VEKVLGVVLVGLLAGAPASAEVARGAPDGAGGDVERVLRARAGLRRAVEFVRAQPALLDRRRRTLPTREEKLALWGAWATVLDHTAALEPIRRELGGWGTPREDGARHPAARAAFLAGYRFALDLIALTARNPALDRILDEEVPELGLPRGAWRRYKLHNLNALRATEFAALDVLARGEAPPGDALAAAIAEDREVIWAMGKGEGHALTARNAVAVVARAGASAVFPFQQGLSTWLGDTRVRRGESALVSEEQIARLPARLEPGDVLLERREWYLSNLGLPGFWTHAALYVGTAEERRAFFDDPEVRAWVREQGREDGDLEALLASTTPAYGRSAAPDAAGHLPRVLEAVSEGVAFTTLEHSAAADSLAALRPRLPRRDRAVAVARAFGYAGRPYDFDFDFLTDSALVCSELVYKVYEPGAATAGLRLELESIAGRRMATPNGIARLVDVEAAAGRPQLDVAVFLDGSEKTGAAVDAPAESFRSSWKRPKWHVLVAR